MDYKKDDRLIIDIVDIGNDGEGIGKVLMSIWKIYYKQVKYPKR